MDLMLGLDDFGEAVRSQINFVDKSLFIKKVIDDKATHVPVIVRPRRFGKTFNLSMLHHFLAAEVNGLSTQGLFDGLKIAQAGDVYAQQQGQYPVIFISFKNVKKEKYHEAYAQLTDLVSQTYSQYDYLLSSAAIPDYEKKHFEEILKKTVDPAAFENALQKLCRYLYLHHGVKPWLLIDEYDTPIQAAYVHSYYSPMIDFMRSLFGAALKGNPYLHRAVVTGILRIAKENLFSGINNLKVFSVLDADYSEYFGFTEDEVDEVLIKAELKHLSTEIKAWYNGYQMGGHQTGSHQIYNPWSIANCVREKGKIEPYWANTSDNALIKTLLAKADANIKTQFELILAGQTIETMIDESMVFADLDISKDALWSLLLFSGYLTCKEMKLAGMQYNCLLMSPNQEVSVLYQDIIRKWFSDSLGRDTYQALLISLTEARLDDFLFILQKFLLESASYFDVKGTEPEKFYHGFVMGLIVSLSDTHIIQSNKESGYGRYDVIIIPKDTSKLGLILEFKVARPNKTLIETAEEALAQLHERRYETVLQQNGITNIMQIGLAFRGKDVELASNRLANH